MIRAEIFESSQYEELSDVSGVRIMVEDVARQ